MLISGIFSYFRHYYRPSHLKDGNRRAVRDYVERMRSGDVELQQVSCPNCRVSQGDLLFNRDRYGIPWKTVVCRECGMLYSNPQMTSTSTKLFYSSDDYRRIYGSGDLLRDSADMFDLKSIDRTDEYHRLTYFDFIMNSGAHIESVAEIGAGGGWNLVPFIDKGIECQGYDFSPQLIEAGRQQGITMIDLSDTVLSGQYDLIMLRHVLEHVDDPIQQLQQLSPHLTENGQLFIEVPGIVGKIPSLQNAHYHYFSEATLDSILGQAGYEVTHRQMIQRNGYLLVLANYSGTTRQPAKIRGEYERVLKVVAKGRRGMCKATIVESLPSPLKRALLSTLKR
jgi:SAM-dependent methyltransferase